MHQLFEHKADIGVRGIGSTLEEAFAECAKAMFNAMADLEKVEANQAEKVEARADSKEQLLVEFLNHLLYLKDVKETLFSHFNLYITGVGGQWQLKGEALGEKANKEKHSIRGDVKAASYHQLKVAEKAGKWVAQCVVDV